MPGGAQLTYKDLGRRRAWVGARVTPDETSLHITIVSPPDVPSSLLCSAPVSYSRSWCAGRDPTRVAWTCRMAELPDLPHPLQTRWPKNGRQGRPALPTARRISDTLDQLLNARHSKRAPCLTSPHLEECGCRHGARASLGDFDVIPADIKRPSSRFSPSPNG